MVLVKIFNVDNSYREFEMTDNELVYAILGDDFGGAPPSSIKLFQTDHDGKENAISAIYRKDKPKKSSWY